MGFPAKKKPVTLPAGPSQSTATDTAKAWAMLSLAYLRDRRLIGDHQKCIGSADRQYAEAKRILNEAITVAINHVTRTYK